MPDIYRGLAGYNLLSSGYWERKSNLSGDFDGIIANDNAIGQFYLEVRGTDAALKTACPLTRLEHAPQPTENNPSKLAPGTYLIGRDSQVFIEGKRALILQARVIGNGPAMFQARWVQFLLTITPQVNTLWKFSVVTLR